ARFQVFQQGLCFGGPSSQRPSSSSYVPNDVAHDVNTDPTLVIGLGPVLKVLTKTRGVAPCVAEDTVENQSWRKRARLNTCRQPRACHTTVPRCAL
ncbi:hypothetical protein OS493_029671, partial [Desmophyllum pertusum]